MKKSVVYHICKKLAILSRLISYKWYMKLIIKAHKYNGVNFRGKPEYVHQDAYLDASGGLTIDDNVVISTRVVILSHDYSFLKRENGMVLRDRKTVREHAFKKVVIGRHSFVGAGAIILPGSVIGKYCIVGAGAVIKGNVPDYSIIIGNPAQIIGKTN